MQNRRQETLLRLAFVKVWRLDNTQAGWVGLARAIAGTRQSQLTQQQTIIADLNASIVRESRVFAFRCL